MKIIKLIPKRNRKVKTAGLQSFLYNEAAVLSNQASRFINNNPGHFSFSSGLIA